MAITQEHEQSPGMTRRSFMVGTVGASLMMAFGVFPKTSKAAATSTNEALAARQFAPTIWFEIDAQGRILVNIAKAEMGQHVGTALARIVADELGANWDDIHIKYVDFNPKWGFMITGGSGQS